MRTSSPVCIRKEETVNRLGFGLLATFSDCKVLRESSEINNAAVLMLTAHIFTLKAPLATKH